MQFDASGARGRVERFWSLGAAFGMERSALHVYLNEIVSDRYVLVNGLQMLRDELQLADPTKEDSDVAACAADVSVPSVVPTVAATNCGDRANQGEATVTYRQVVAERFATISEIGDLKMELFNPTGGGTDDGATFAHVTVAHALDGRLRARIYGGNALSYQLYCFDLKTHVGRMEPEPTTSVYGQTQESRFREPRAACGAIVRTIQAFDEKNPVHVRVRRDLGEDNYHYLRDHKILADDGTPVNMAVAAAIVVIQGMRNTARALESEMDERGVAHLTASTTVNRPSMNDTILYFARATVFHGETCMQGMGIDARKYGARMLAHDNDRRLLLTYDGQAQDQCPIERSQYRISAGAGH
jgi:hypothetical protein